MVHYAVVFILLAATSVLQTAQASRCLGPSKPAKYRYIWQDDLKDNSPATLNNISILVDKWMDRCTAVVRHGHGPAVTTTPSAYGFEGPIPKSTTFAQYGAWSDWESLDDLKACYVKGIESGAFTTLAPVAKSVVRLAVAFESSCGLVAVSNSSSCSPSSFAPATVRYLFTYNLKNKTAVPRALELQNQTLKAVAVKPLRYGIGGNAVLAIATEVEFYGKDNGPRTTGDFGGWMDFASMADVTAYLSSPAYGKGTILSREELRGMAAKTRHIVITLPSPAAAAATTAAPDKANAKEKAAAAGKGTAKGQKG